MLYYTDHPTVPRDSIVAQLNMDMVGRGRADDENGGGPGYLQLIGTRRLSTELGDLIETVNKARKQPFTFDYQFDATGRSEEHTSELQSRSDLVCRLLLEKKKTTHHPKSVDALCVGSPPHAQMLSTVADAPGELDHPAPEVCLPVAGPLHPAQCRSSAGTV